MKGVIFNSLIAFAEDRFGAAFVDELLYEVPLESGGAYTAVGTYSIQELLDMLAYILRHQDVDAVDIQQAFGIHTFGVLTEHYPDLISGFHDCFDCIFHVDQVIHKNVRKLYPDAELPMMKARLDKTGNRLELEYRSSRPLAHFAHGLLLGCIRHFHDEADVQMKDHSNGEGTRAHFVVTRNA